MKVIKSLREINNDMQKHLLKCSITFSFNNLIITTITFKIKNERIEFRQFIFRLEFFIRIYIKEAQEEFKNDFLHLFIIINASFNAANNSRISEFYIK